MIPKPETLDWIFDAARWWLQTCDGFEAFSQAGSVLLPTEEDFPVDNSLTGDALAQDYFAFAVEHAKLNEWPFELMPDHAPNVAEALQGMPHGMTSAPVSEEGPPLLGEDDPFTIPYDVSQLDDPLDLVATIARGMSHYVLLTAPTEFSGELDEQEYFVDLGAVFLGFGVFLANTSFRFEQTQSGLMVGWGFSRRGALSALDVSYALALVATLLDAPDPDIVSHLAPNPKAFYKAAKKHLRKKRSAEVDALRSVVAVSGGPYR